jgi:hypothetical protein
VGGSGDEKEGKEVRKVGGGVDRVLGGASAGAWLSMLAFVARVRRVGLWVAGRGYGQWRRGSRADVGIESGFGGWSKG